MASNNDITGDAIRSKPGSDNYRDNWDRIFGPCKEGVKKGEIAVVSSGSVKDKPK